MSRLDRSTVGEGWSCIRDSVAARMVDWIGVLGAVAAGCGDRWTVGAVEEGGCFVGSCAGCCQLKRGPMGGAASPDAEL